MADSKGSGVSSFQRTDSRWYFIAFQAQTRCITFAGSLHLGNIFLNSGQAVLTGLPNFIGGVSGKMRALAIKAKVIMIVKMLRSSPFFIRPSALSTIWMSTVSATRCMSFHAGRRAGSTLSPTFPLKCQR